MILHTDTAANTCVSFISNMPMALYGFISGDVDWQLLSFISLIVTWLLGQGFIFVRWYFDRKRKKDEQ